MSGFFKSLEVGAKLASSVLLLSESLSYESTGVMIVLGLASVAPLAWGASTRLGPGVEPAASPESL